MGKKKKIAVVIPRFGLVGGAENFASELATRIAAEPRYDVHVFANRWREDGTGITFHRVPIIRFPRSLTTPSFAWFANRAIAKEGVDLIHTHDRIFEADLFTMHGIPHRLWVRDVRKKRMSLFDRATSRVEDSLARNPRCRRFLAVSTITKEKFLSEYPEDAGKVLIVPPGTDVGRFERLNREKCRQEVRRSLGLEPSALLLLFVSMNFEVKGLDYVMQGLAAAETGNGRARAHAVRRGAGKRRPIPTAGGGARHREECSLFGGHGTGQPRCPLPGKRYLRHALAL